MKAALDAVLKHAGPAEISKLVHEAEVHRVSCDALAESLRKMLFCTQWPPSDRIKAEAVEALAKYEAQQ